MLQQRILICMGDPKKPDAWWRSQLSIALVGATATLIAAVIGGIFALMGNDSDDPPTEDSRSGTTITTSDVTESSGVDETSDSGSANTTANVTPIIRYKGTLDLAQDYAVDLDQQTPDGAWRFGDLWDSDGDIFYNVDNLKPQDMDEGETTRLAIITGSSANYSTCARASRFVNWLDIQEIEAGSLLCVHTDRGRLALLKVLQVPKESDSPPTISFVATVWDK